jgi:hypothetical protein
MVPVLLWRGRLGSGSRSSLERVADLQPRQSGVGHFSYRSSAPLISEASCGMWVFGSATCSMWHAVVVPLRCGKQASLRGLIRFLFLEGSTWCGSFTWCPPPVGAGCMAHWPLPRQGFDSHSDELVGGILVVGTSLLQVCGWS